MRTSWRSNEAEDASPADTDIDVFDERFAVVTHGQVVGLKIHWSMGSFSGITWPSLAAASVITLPTVIPLQSAIVAIAQQLQDPPKTHMHRPSVHIPIDDDVATMIEDISIIIYHPEDADSVHYFYKLPTE